MFSSRRVLLLIILAILPSGSSSAQEVASPVLDPTWRESQYVYHDWQVEDGLPQNSVFAIEQTDNGYLWLGTQEGLVRFDGTRFTIYTSEELGGLVGNAVSALFKDSKGRLWIGTDTGGLGRLDSDSLVNYNGSEGLPSNGIRSLFEDTRGNIWVGTVGGGIVRYDGKTFRQFTTKEGLAGPVVLAIDEDNEGNIWAGTNAGISRIREANIQSFTSATGLPGDEVWSIETSESGAVWVGTNNGLARFHRNAFVKSSALNDRCNGTIADIMRDPAGTLWIATLESGVCRITDEGIQVFERPSLTSNHVRRLFTDREGSVWVGTDGGGLNQVRAAKFAVYGTPEGLSDDMAHTVFEDAEGNIWIGTEAGGLNKITNGAVTTYGAAEGLASDYVLTVDQDPQGVLWVGTYDGGLCRLNGNRFHCIGKEDGLPSNFVRVVYHDSRGIMWMGTDVGLHRLTDPATMTFSDEESLVDQSVTSVLEDQSGNLWVGTWSGLSRSGAQGPMEPVQLEGGQPVMTLFEDSHGALWIGTYGGGLCRRRGSDVKCYHTTDGNFDESAIQILEDAGGYLWFGSNKGIWRIARADFDAYDAGKSASLNPLVFDENSGLRSREANGGSPPSAFRTRDGRLWFSTLKGTAVISPLSFQINPIPPRAMLESVWINDVLEPHTQGVGFEPGSRKLEFRYTAASFVAPEKVRFQYRLDPYDQGWTDAGSRREAYYTNLPPGEYTFRVRAANNDGVWSESEATLTFRLRPHFYQTTWFYILCVFAGLAVVFVAYRLRTQNLKSRERRLSRLVAKQTRELQEQKQELEKLNQNLEHEVQRQLDLIMKERLRYERELISAKEKAEESARFKSIIMSNMSHELRTPLTAILGFGQILTEELDEEHQEFLRYMNSNANRLLQTLDAILELSALQAGSLDLNMTDVDLTAAARGLSREFADVAENKGLKLICESSTEPVFGEGDQEALTRAMRKIVENAIKFTPHGEIRISVGHEDRNVFIRVKDTGIGINESFLPQAFDAFKQESDGIARTHEGNGIGLTVAQLFVKAMDGRIDVQSHPGAGSAFTVYLKARRPAVAAVAA